MTGGADIHSLTVLPDKLKTELALHVNLDTLKKVSIFKNCQPEFLHDLVLKMRAVIFTPEDIICRKGEIAREMYIIADGVLDVLKCVCVQVMLRNRFALQRKRHGYPSNEIGRLLWRNWHIKSGRRRRKSVGESVSAVCASHVSVY
jgi:hypothetical protein